jgi:hypothetical protein
VLARILLAETLLEFLLGLVARHVHGKEGMVVCLALGPELDPLLISGLVPDDLTLKPATELAIAMSSTRLTVTCIRWCFRFRWVGWFLIGVGDGERLTSNGSVAIRQVWAEA